uniref:Si:ch211-265o23.1 n=1 Tax=Salarias fasciatus TaxID=181472 RepID=A0A672GCB9_SALFA
MALDLTPRFRRLNSQTRSFRESLRHGFSGPFGATQLWHNIIRALQTQVEVRRRRRHLRVHADCFTGCDAVDAVLSYLMQNVAFCTSEVSRLKAARLCQALMEAKVFEPVGARPFHRSKEAVFEDSSCSLYRFLDYQSFDREGFCRLREVRTFSNPLAVGSSDRRVEQLLQTIHLQPSSSPGSSAFLSRAEMDEVWKQQTLLQLLQLVEIPMLDCILTPPAACRAPVLSQDLVISNTCLDRELPDALSLSPLDDWLSAAADCLELFPDQLIVVAGEQLSRSDGGGGGSSASEQEDGQKRLLFDTIVKHYSSPDRAPLLSGRYLDIHVAILHFLDEGKVQEATRASQLCLRLLESGVRDELRRLLAFMSQAAQRHACRLQKQTENRTLVCRSFQRALLQNQDLTRDQTETLVLFLLDNHTELFKTPTTLIEAVRKTLRSMQQGKDPDSIATFTFCQQVSPQEYEDQREATTLQSLKQLLQHISSTQSLGAKQRRALLRDFQKHHPVVFLQHVSSSF